MGSAGQPPCFGSELANGARHAATSSGSGIPATEPPGKAASGPRVALSASIVWRSEESSPCCVGCTPGLVKHSQNAVIHKGSVVLRATPVLQPALLKIAAEAASTRLYSTSSWHALLTLLITLATFHFVP